MKRKILEQLVAWKHAGQRKPLLLTGVRQCGKTYILNEFGTKEFDHYVYLNFEKQTMLSTVFDYDLDSRRILTELGKMVVGEPIVPGKTLVVFDEIQACPRAITSLKYFCEDLPELHIVAAGSLLGVALAREGVSFPVGKVDRLEMYPMTFREFVWAVDGESRAEAIEDIPLERPLPELLTVPMEKLYKDYLIVGGMPEAVQTFVDTGSYEAVEAVQENILADYADDFAKHAPLKEVPKIRWIWESVPRQLAKENNKFVFSHVKAGKRSAELEDALLWLKNAGLIYPLTRVEHPRSPLKMQEDATYFKVYLSDVGLLRKRAGLHYRSILEDFDNYSAFKGSLAENYVLTELKAMGRSPHFWRSGNSAEVDFLLEEEGEVIPVEVKAATNTRAKSFRQYCERYRPKYGVKLSLKNQGRETVDGTEVRSIPLYAIPSAFRS